MESEKDTNHNYFQRQEESKKVMENNEQITIQRPGETYGDKEIEEDEEKDVFLEIISNKVVELMMSTGGVSDKYIPAVRSMQEGNFFLTYLLKKFTFTFILYNNKCLSNKYTILP